jgi:hypothetical protein
MVDRGWGKSVRQSDVASPRSRRLHMVANPSLLLYQVIKQAPQDHLEYYGMPASATLAVAGPLDFLHYGRFP